jgi:hypothetical protein
MAARCGRCVSDRPITWWIAKVAEGKAERSRIQKVSAKAHDQPERPPAYSA